VELQHPQVHEQEEHFVESFATDPTSEPEDDNQKHRGHEQEEQRATENAWQEQPRTPVSKTESPSGGQGEQQHKEDYREKEKQRLAGSDANDLKQQGAKGVVAEEEETQRRVVEDDEATTDSESESSNGGAGGKEVELQHPQVHEQEEHFVESFATDPTSEPEDDNQKHRGHEQEEQRATENAWQEQPRTPVSKTESPSGGQGEQQHKEDYREKEKQRLAEECSDGFEQESESEASTGAFRASFFC